MVPSVSVLTGFNCSLGSVTKLKQMFRNKCCSKVSFNSSKVYEFHICDLRQVVRGAVVTGGR